MSFSDTDVVIFCNTYKATFLFIYFWELKARGKRFLKQWLNNIIIRCLSCITPSPTSALWFRWWSFETDVLNSFSGLFFATAMAESPFRS